MSRNKQQRSPQHSAGSIAFSISPLSFRLASPSSWTPGPPSPLSSPSTAGVDPSSILTSVPTAWSGEAALSGGEEEVGAEMRTPAPAPVQGRCA